MHPFVNLDQLAVLAEYWCPDERKEMEEGNSPTREKMCRVLHSKKDGTLVNVTAKENMEKMDELISQQQTPLTFTSSVSIASSGNDVFSQVLGKERNGQIHGLGFGLTPSKFGLSSITIGSSFKVELEEESLRDKETICKLKEELVFQEQK